MKIKNKRDSLLNIKVEYLKQYSIVLFILSTYLILSAKSSTLNSDFLIAVGVIFVGVACYKFSQYLNIMSEIKGLDKPVVMKITLEDLSKQRRFVNEVLDTHGTLLGRGFIWGQDVAEKYFNLTQVPEISRHITSSNPESGQNMIHNIGSRDEEYRVSKLPEHTAVIGTTGVGKSTMMTTMIAQRIEDDEAVIILDPKGDKDVLDNVYRICQSYGKEESFLYFSPAHIRKSQTYNPFSASLKSSDIASRLTNILGEGGGDNQVFLDYCGSAIIVASDLMLAMNERVTLKSIQECLYHEPLVYLGRAKEMLKTVKNPNMFTNLEDSIKSFKSFRIDTDNEHFNKMTTSLKSRLTLLATKELGENLCTEKPSISWGDVVTNKRIVYFYLGSMLDSIVASSIGKLVLQDLLQWIGQQYAYSHKHLPVSLFGDEFYNIVFPSVVDILSKSRGANFRATFFMQTQADISAQTKIDVAKQIFGNISNKIVFQMPELELAEVLSNTFGEIMYTKKIITRGSSATLGAIDQPFKDSQSERIDREAGTIITPQTLMSLAKGHCFCMSSGMPLLKLVSPYMTTDTDNNFSYFNMINERRDFDTTIKSDVQRLADLEVKRMVNSNHGNLLAPPILKRGEEHEVIEELEVKKVKVDTTIPIPNFNSLDEKDN